jgi:predicted PurR-regulated permease PerM
MANDLRRFTATAPARWAQVGLFLIALIAALRIGSTLILPILIAGMLALLLAPPVAWMVKRRLPPTLAAGLVVLALVCTVAFGIRMLATPAVTWLERAPETIAQAERKIKRLTKPLETLQATAEKVEQVTSGNNGNDRARAVTVAPAGLFQKLSGTTTAMMGALMTVIFLTFFLLSWGAKFRAKLANLLPDKHRKGVDGAIQEMQEQMSAYLFTATMINSGVGLLTYLALWLLDYPNPGLWAVAAGVLNFIPYLGAMVTIIIIFLAGLVTFDTAGPAFMGAGAFFIINLAEANVVTPVVLGRRLPLNPVAIFTGLLFWGWMWGVTGAVLAVPLMVMMKVMADRIEPLKPLGVLLDN